MEIKTTVKLTSKELEILKLLKNGENSFLIEICEKLFLYEFIEYNQKNVLALTSKGLDIFKQIEHQSDVLKCINIKPLTGNDVAPNLTDGLNYRILAIIKCSCGQDHYDVGLTSLYNFIRCHDCKEHLPNGENVHWCHPTRFINIT